MPVSRCLVGQRFKDALNGSGMDRIFLFWYTVSAVGMVAGAVRYQSTTPLEVVLGDGDVLGMLWWKTASLMLVIFFIDLAWRLRLLHGGADAKALMWVSLVFPTWTAVPLPFSNMAGESVVALPVSIALLIWGGLAFLLIPFVMLILNFKRGDIRKVGDLRLAWHASMMSVKDVPHRHVWLLTDTMAMPNGEERVVHATRAPRTTPTGEALAEHLGRLEALDVEKVWVSHKMPLLVFLFPAVLPLVLFGDSTTLLLAWLN